MVDITLLGTSALLPLPDRATTALFLECAGHGILFDCGEGTQISMRRCSASMMKIDVIALSHYHGDHIFGLPGLLQTIACLGRTRPVYITGPEDPEGIMDAMRKLIGGLPFELRFVELTEEGTELNTLSEGWQHGARLTPFATTHRVPSRGYVFTLPRSPEFLPEKAQALGVPVSLWSRLQRGECVEHDGAVILPGQVSGPPRRGIRVVFSGDTVRCEALRNAAQDADLLVCEATYGDNEHEQLAAEHGHMTFAHAAQTAAEAEAKRLWLTHYSQMVTDPLEYIDNARQYFPQTECGFDGKSITLKFE